MHITFLHIHAYIFTCMGFLLLDNNECDKGTHDCSPTTQTCMNTIGSFTCECRSGYKLDVNGTTCIGMYKLLVLFW